VRKYVVLCAAVALALPAWAASADQGHPAGGTGGPVDCGSGTVTWTPTTLWPPNHKLTTVTITYNGDNDGDKATVAVTGWSDDETVDGIELNGSGAPDSVQGPDVVPGAPGTGPDNAPVTTTAQVRSERSGRGDGRVYTLTVRCTESDMDSGTADITVSVPHDQGHR